MAATPFRNSGSECSRSIRLRLKRRAVRPYDRQIDTAEMYRNEKEVGEAVWASGLDRSEIFITSKLNNGFHKPDDARRAFDGTLEALGSDYVDLFLIHSDDTGTHQGELGNLRLRAGA